MTKATVKVQKKSRIVLSKSSEEFSLCNKGSIESAVKLANFLRNASINKYVLYGHQNDQHMKAGSRSKRFSSSDTYDICKHFAAVNGFDALCLTGNEFGKWYWTLEDRINALVKYAEKVVKNLADLIDIETISPQVDPFQSVFDVIYGAVRINDFTTMSTGLACAEERFKELIANRPTNWQDDYISFRLFDDIKRCGFLLIEKREDKYVFEIITRLKTINEWAFKEQRILVLNRSCSAIEDVAVKACEYNLVSVVNHSLTTLKETAKSIGGIEGLSQDDGITKKWRHTLFSFVESISNIGKASVRHDLDTSSQKAIEILDSLGRYAIEKNLIFEDDFVFKRIGEIILEYVNRDKTTLVNSSVQMLRFLGGYAVDHNHSKEALWILDKLRKIGKSVARQKKTRFIRRVVDAIQYIAISATEKKRSDIEANAIDLIVKFKLIYPALFKREKEVQLLDYGHPDTIRVSKEDYDMVLQHESDLVDEYLRPPDDWEGAYDDDDTMILSL